MLLSSIIDYKYYINMSMVCIMKTNLLINCLLLSLAIHWFLILIPNVIMVKFGSHFYTKFYDT